MNINSVIRRWQVLCDEVEKKKYILNNKKIVKLLQNDVYHCLYIAQDRKDNLYIYIEFESDDILKTYTLPTIEGIRLEISHDRILENRKYLCVVKDEICPAEIFISFSLSVSEALRDTSSDVKAIEKLEKTLNDYSNLFSRKKNSIGRSSEQGLFCELYYLQELIYQYGDEAVSFWCGPEKNKHDFVFSSSQQAVEIKSTADQEQLIISISNENQLSTAGLKELKLIVYVVESLDTGISVEQKINDVLESITSVDQRKHFISKLAMMGVDPYVYEGEYRFKIESSHVFIVDSAFPKISKDTIPATIYDVKYRLNLSGYKESE